MSNDDDKFEKYLRIFAGPALPPGALDRAMRRARRQRAVRVFAAASAIVAAACILIIAFIKFSALFWPFEYT